MMFCLGWRLEHQGYSVVPVWGQTLTFHWGGTFQITIPRPSLHDIAAPQPINLQLVGISYWICDSFLNACFGRPVPWPQLKSFPDSCWNETMYIGFEMYSLPFWSFLKSFFEVSLHYMIPFKWQFYTFFTGNACSNAHNLGKNQGLFLSFWIYISQDKYWHTPRRILSLQLNEMWLFLDCETGLSENPHRHSKNI